MTNQWEGDRKDSIGGRTVFTVDTHTAGEPTRIVLRGARFPSGKTIADKQVWMRENDDVIRRALMREPRGHSDMFGAILCEVEDSDIADESADLGVIFMDGGGYLDMCVHGTMGVAVAAVAMGLVHSRDGRASLKIETPVGLVQAEVELMGERAGQVTVDGVPSVLLASHVDISHSAMSIPIDLSYGGNITALVDAEDLARIGRSFNLHQLIDLGQSIRSHLNDLDLEIVLPDFVPAEASIALVEFTAGEPADKALRSVVTFGHGSLDRSPCGSGLAAKLAQLYAKSEMVIGDWITAKSPIGSTFEGRVAEEIGSHNGFPVIRPQIRGRAAVTGFHQFHLDDLDPYAGGFVVDLASAWLA